MPNRLASEPSPYLQQHAANPVDWYPWGEEAFARARREDKPIFLSVGYSTCHWCHVMERESFESAEIARVLNEHFVPVKVDREERPDVDRVYMTFVQATTGAGGWPMSVWLTPDLKPFFGGTYFPADARWGRPGFVDLLQEIARIWKADRTRVQASADDLVGRLRERIGAPAAGDREQAAGPLPGREALAAGVGQFRQVFDPQHGGFGGAPKFPRPAELFFLLRAWHLTGEDAAREMAVRTLSGMASGGMRDHLGGGFHRYSVDAQWRVPHFEKMLYDQAQLALACLEAAQATGEAFWAGVARETLEYVRRDLTHPEGGFYSAEDADSVPVEQAGQPRARKVEGAFYVWGAPELDALLGADAEVVKLRFGVEPGGNALEDPHGELRGQNILYLAREIDDIARETGRDARAVRSALDAAVQVLRETRAGRPRPHLDDKILTAWNGLMIAAFARAARTAVREEGTLDSGARDVCRDTAQRAAAFIRRELWDPSRRTLLRRFRDGRAAIDAYCEDYACLIWGLVELFQADGDAGWLEWALELQGRQDELFWDSAEGGWFSTSGEDPSVLLRLKEDYDGAEPSAGAVSALNVLALAHLTGAPPDHAGRTLARIGRHLASAARVVPMMMSAFAAWHAGGQQVVVVGPPRRDDTERLLQVVRERYLPFALVVPVEPGAAQERVASLLPWVHPMGLRDGRATAYVCRNFACDAPVTEAGALAALLEREGA